MSDNIEVIPWGAVQCVSSDDGQRPRSAGRVSQHASTSEHAQAAPRVDVKCVAVQVWILLGPDSLVKEWTGAASIPWGQAAPRVHNPRKKAVHQEEGPCAGVQPQSHDEGAAKGCPFCTPQLPERVSSLSYRRKKYHLEHLGVGRG